MDGGDDLVPGAHEPGTGDEALEDPELGRRKLSRLALDLHRVAVKIDDQRAAGR